MSKLKKLIFILSFIVLYLAAGYFRDFFFININKQLHALGYVRNSNPEPIDETLLFITVFSYKQLFIIKWILTIVFGILYWGIGMSVIKFLTSNENIYRKGFTMVYLALIVISSLFISTGWILSDNTWTYTTSKFLMDIAQSPKVIMFLIPATFIKNSSNEKNN